MDPDSKQRFRVSALESWRPQRDLNPYYRRESIRRFAALQNVLCSRRGKDEDLRQGNILLSM